MTYKPQGIIHVTGEPDVGKTLLAIGAYHPKKTAYFFDDVKKPPVDEKEFGLFIDLVGKYSNTKLLGFYYAIKQEIDSIPDNAFDCIIFDTWARTGKAIRYYAKANPYEFREKETFSNMGRIKGMEEWGEAHNVEAAFISALSRKAKALFLITHIKEKIIAGAKSGLMQPDCGKSFSKICNLRLWLRHNEQSAVPIALVLKRISKTEISDNGIEIVNVLPRRVQPVQEDTSIWQTVNRYWESPVGNLEPLEQEKPTEYELSILDGILTTDQKEVWHAELAEKKRLEKEEKQFLDGEVKTKVKELLKSYDGPDLLPLKIQWIMPQIKEEYPDLSEDDVGQMVK